MALPMKMPTDFLIYSHRTDTEDPGSKISYTSRWPDYYSFSGIRYFQLAGTLTAVDCCEDRSAN